MYDQTPQHQNEGYTQVFAWGSNRQKQLGVGQRGTQPLFPLPKLQSFGIVIQQISCGHDHSGFIANNGLIFMFGSNSLGQLGVGDPSLKSSDNPLLVETLSMFQAVSLSCGAYHSGTITEKGQVYAWGQGQNGALGYGGHDNQIYPVRMVSHTKNAGTSPLATPSAVCGKSVSCGESHTLVLDVSGRVFSCGNNDHGQLGTWNKESDCSLVPIAGVPGEKIAQVAAGQKYSLILTESGKIYGSGNNSKGQLGSGNRNSEISFKQCSHVGVKFSKVYAGGFSAAISASKELYLWGENPSFGESLVPTREPKINNIKQAAIGGKFIVTVSESGLIHSWGIGYQGELGNGGYQTSEEPELVSQLESKVASKVAAGENHIIALGQDILPQSQSSAARAPVSANTSQIPHHSNRNSPSRSPGRSSALRQFPNTSSLNNTNSISRAPHSDYRSTSPFQGGGRLAGQSGKYFNNDAPNTVEDLQSRLQAERLKRQSQDFRAINTSASRGTSEKPLQDMLEDNRQLMRLKNENNRLLTKLSDIQQDLDISKRDNRNLQDQLIQLKKDRQADSSQLHQVLKEYENKMAEQIDSKHVMVKEKSKEIANLHDIITKLESDLANEKLQRQRVDDYYNSQIDKVNVSLRLAEEKLGITTVEADSLKDKQQADSSRIGQLTSNVQRMHDTIHSLEKENAQLKELIEKEKQLADKLKNELVNESERANEHEKNLNDVKSTLNGLSMQYENQTGQNNQQIETLRAAVNDLNYNKSDLINQITSSHQEKEDLYREVISWKELVNRLTEENTQLKHIIEDLEQKNKKFSETLNTHLYNRASEFKARAMNALKNSHSPFRGGHGAPPRGNNLNHTADMVSSPFDSMASPYRGPATPNRGIHQTLPDTASTGYPKGKEQPPNSQDRFNQLLQDEAKQAEDEEELKNMLKTDHDHVQAMKDIEQSKNKEPSHPQVNDFNYGNVADKDQYSPSRDPTLVNSNYALVNNLDDLEGGNSPGRRSNIGLHPVSIGDHNRASPTRSGYNHPEHHEMQEPSLDESLRPPSVAQSAAPFSHNHHNEVTDPGMMRSLSVEDLQKSPDSSQIRRTAKRQDVFEDEASNPKDYKPGVSTNTTPVRQPRHVPPVHSHDPTKPPESGRNIGEPTFYRADNSGKQKHRNEQIGQRFDDVGNSVNRLGDMLGIDSPIKKSIAHRTMTSPQRDRNPYPHQVRQPSPIHPMDPAGQPTNRPFASYNPSGMCGESVQPNRVASKVTAQMVRDTMQKVKADLDKSKDANKNVSQGLVEYEKRLKERDTGEMY